MKKQMVSAILELKRDRIRYVDRPQKTAACIGVFLMAFAACTAAQTEDATQTEANAAVTDFCSSQIYTDAVATELRNWIATTAAGADALAKEAGEFALAAAKKLRTAEGRAYAFLSTIATRRAEVAAGIASKTATTATAALEVIKRRQGELAAHYALHKQAENLKPKEHNGAPRPGAIIGTSASKGGICTVTTQAEPYISEKLRPSTKKHNNAAKIGPILKKATRLRLGKAEKLVLAAPTITIEATGDLGTRDNWKQTTDKTACEVKGGAASTKPTEATDGVVLHTITTKTTMVVDELELKATEAREQQQDQTRDEGHVLIEDATIIAAVLAAQLNYKQPPKKVSEETVESLAATTEAQRLAAYLQNKEGAKIKLETDTAKIAQEIFGMKEGGINEKFLEPLKKEPVNIPTENEPIKGNIQENADGPNFETLMAYYSSQNLKKAAAASPGIKPDGDTKADSADKQGETNDGDNKATAAECKATEEGKCDTTKCTWNKDKNECKAKEGAYISAVVKVPLLLAFLLF